jgi:hypothetical protein
LEEIFLQLTRDEPIPPETSEQGLFEDQALEAGQDADQDQEIAE